MPPAVFFSLRFALAILGLLWFHIILGLFILVLWKTGNLIGITLDSIFKSRDITLPTKVCLVKAMVFPVVKYGCESWTVKKAECRRIDAFELWCWRRLLRVPWTARRSNQSILKEISPGCSLEGLIISWNPNTLSTSYEELTHWKRLWCWEGLVAGGEGDDRGWDGWMALPTWCTWVWVNSGSWWWTGRPGVLQFMGLQRVRHNWATELNWTDKVLKYQSQRNWSALIDISSFTLPSQKDAPGFSIPLTSRYF